MNRSELMKSKYSQIQQNTYFPYVFHEHVDWEANYITNFFLINYSILLDNSAF